MDLAAFSPATITLSQTSGEPFSLLSIDLARNFAFDPAPTVTFTGTLAAGGTVSETFTVTQPAGSPQTFQTFNFTGFTGLSSVSWDQPVFTQGLHQFANIHPLHRGRTGAFRADLADPGAGPGPGLENPQRPAWWAGCELPNPSLMES